MSVICRLHALCRHLCVLQECLVHVGYMSVTCPMPTPLRAAGVPRRPDLHGGFRGSLGGSFYPQQGSFTLSSALLPSAGLFCGTL